MKFLLLNPSNILVGLLLAATGAIINPSSSVNALGDTPLPTNIDQGSDYVDIATPTSMEYSTYKVSPVVYKPGPTSLYDSPSAYNRGGESKSYSYEPAGESSSYTFEPTGYPHTSSKPTPTAYNPSQTVEYSSSMYATPTTMVLPKCVEPDR